MATLQEIKDYYTNLLIIQYNNLPKARATVDLIIGELMANNVMFDLQKAFTIDDAVGKQLDIIAKWVGIDRYYKGQNFNFANNYFGFTDYSNSDLGQEGFSTYADYNIKVGEVLTYNEIASNNQIIGDNDFRFLIKLKIICNNMNYSQKSIDDLLQDKFAGNLVLTTLNDFKITYFASETIYGIVNIMLQKNLLPKPMGVKLEAVIVATVSQFAFISYNDDITQFSNDNLVEGFSTYADYNIKVGEVMNYQKLIS